MNFKLFSILILIFGAGGAFAQEAPVIKDSTNPNKPEEVYKIDDVRGNIKRRAISLPKPPYPREALEAGADGMVKVEVVIGADGRIVSAKALSGHPMLYQTAEETARKTVFRKDETIDPNATETGVIIYSFAIARENWVRIGFMLTAIQKMPTLRGLNIPRIAKAFQTDWTQEHEMLAKLAEMRRVEVAVENSRPATDRPTLIQRPVQTPGGTKQTTVQATTVFTLPMPYPPTPERIALAQNLSVALQSRLASSELNLWFFNTGSNLAKASELMRVPNEGRNAAQILRQSLDSAPAGVSPEVLEALEKLIEIFESDRRTIDTRTEIGKYMSVIFSNK